MPVKIANYEILKLLGQGSMGQVYLARDSLTDNRVALKLMRALELIPNSDERAAHLRGLFTREGTVSIKFEHPHLISVLDFGEHEGVPFIAMEYFDGYPLDAWITRGRINLKPLSFSEKLRIARQITEGVAYLHTNGILHRDIKPANVLVSDNLKAKVADFGLVKPIEGAALLAGTPAYISPECLRGAPATFQSDIYALGITLVELFSGSQFSANKRQIPLESLIGSEHQDFLWSLAAVLRKSIEGEPDRRFASASEFHQAIHQCSSEFESNRPLFAWAAPIIGAQRLRKEIFLGGLRLRRSTLAKSYLSTATLVKYTAVCLLLALGESLVATALLKLVTTHPTRLIRLFSFVLLPLSVFVCGMMGQLRRRKKSGPLEVVEISKTKGAIQLPLQRQRTRWKTISESTTIALVSIWVILCIRLLRISEFSSPTDAVFTLYFLGFSACLPLAAAGFLQLSDISHPALLRVSGRKQATAAQLVVPTSRGRLSLKSALAIYFALGVAALSALVMSGILVASKNLGWEILGGILFLSAGFFWLPQERAAEAIADFRNSTNSVSPELTNYACHIFDATEPFNRIARNALVGISSSVLFMIPLAFGLVLCSTAYKAYLASDAVRSLLAVFGAILCFLFALIPYRLFRESLRRRRMLFSKRHEPRGQQGDPFDATTL